MSITFQYVKHLPVFIPYDLSPFVFRSFGRNEPWSRYNETGYVIFIERTFM